MAETYAEALRALKLHARKASRAAAALESSLNFDTFGRIVVGPHDEPDEHALLALVRMARAEHPHQELEILITATLPLRARRYPVQNGASAAAEDAESPPGDT